MYLLSYFTFTLSLCIGSRVGSNFRYFTNGKQMPREVSALSKGPAATACPGRDGTWASDSHSCDTCFQPSSPFTGLQQTLSPATSESDADVSCPQAGTASEAGLPASSFDSCSPFHHSAELATDNSVHLHSKIKLKGAKRRRLHIKWQKGRVKATV